MERVLGTDYWQDIPQDLQALMRPQPLAIALCAIENNLLLYHHDAPKRAGFAHRDFEQIAKYTGEQVNYVRT